MATAVSVCGDFPRSLGGGCRAGKFLVCREVRGGKKCGFALVWWGKTVSDADCYAGSRHLRKDEQSVGNDPRVVPPQSTTNLNHFYPVAERAAIAALPIPLDGIGRAAAGIRSTANGYTKMCTTKRKGQKIPLVEGLEGS